MTTNIFLPMSMVNRLTSSKRSSAHFFVALATLTTSCLTIIPFTTGLANAAGFWGDAAPTTRVQKPHQSGNYQRQATPSARPATTPPRIMTTYQKATPRNNKKARSGRSGITGSLYLQFGTEGFGLGYAYPLNYQHGLRGEINYGKLGKDGTLGGLIEYEADIELMDVSFHYDFFPFSGNDFRLTTGLSYNDSELTGKASVSGQELLATAEFPQIMPYFGIGYGHRATPRKGLSFFGDLGFFYGSPKTSFVLEGSDTLSEELAEEQRKFKEHVDDKFKFIPVIKAGVGYDF